MCFDVVREGSGLWFSEVKEQRESYLKHDMELAAIVFALKAWRHYLYNE